MIGLSRRIVWGPAFRCGLRAVSSSIKRVPPSARSVVNMYMDRSLQIGSMEPKEMVDVRTVQEHLSKGLNIMPMPASGPVLPRRTFTNKLLPLVSNYRSPLFHLMQGPSGTGKSMSVLKALEGRENVLYLPMSTGSAHSVLSKALGLPGTRLPIKRLLYTFALASFELLRSCEFDEGDTMIQNVPLLIVVVDDLQRHVYHDALAAEARQLAGSLIESCYGRAHVIFLDNKESILRAESGYGMRLKRLNIDLFEVAELTECISQLVDRNGNLVYEENIGNTPALLSRTESERVVRVMGPHVPQVMEAVHSVWLQKQARQPRDVEAAISGALERYKKSLTQHILELKHTRDSGLTRFILRTLMDAGECRINEAHLAIAEAYRWREAGEGLVERNLADGELDHFFIQGRYWQSAFERLPLEVQESLTAFN